jgi:hypothetical protein
MEITICQPDPLLNTDTQLNSISKTRELINHNGTQASINYLEQKYQPYIKKESFHTYLPSPMQKNYLRSMGVSYEGLNRYECNLLISKLKFKEKMEIPRYRLAVFKNLYKSKLKKEKEVEPKKPYNPLKFDFY